MSDQLHTSMCMFCGRPIVNAMGLVIACACAAGGSTPIAAGLRVPPKISTRQPAGGPWRGAPEGHRPCVRASWPAPIYRPRGRLIQMPSESLDGPPGRRNFTTSKSHDTEENKR